MKINNKLIDNGKILWKNNNPTEDFEGQTINVDLSKYDMYEVIYLNQKNVDRIESSGKIPVGYGGYCVCQGRPRLTFRTITSSSKTGIVFEPTYYYPNYGQTTGNIANAYCIPLYIIGHKTNLFN